MQHKERNCHGEKQRIKFDICLRYDEHVDDRGGIFYQIRYFG